jgi:DNA processing protein
MEKALPWMILKSVPGIGNHLFKRLIERFKRPELVFEAANEDLLRVEGLSPRLAKAIHRHKVPETVKKERHKLWDCHDKAVMCELGVS